MASDSGSCGAVAPVPDSNVDWVAFAPVTVNQIPLKRKNVGGNGEDLVPNLVAGGAPKKEAKPASKAKAKAKSKGEAMKSRAKADQKPRVHKPRSDKPTGCTKCRWSKNGCRACTNA